MTHERERGASLVELLVATAAGLALAAACAQAFAGSHRTYREMVTRMEQDQQAQTALTFIASEVETLVDPPRASGCPSQPIEITTRRVAFLANLFDRTEALQVVAGAGAQEIVVTRGDAFDAGDMVVLTDLGNLGDPGDDASQCVRIETISENRLELDATLDRGFSIGSPVALVNQVTYRLDPQGRLMRTQDGGTQRIADHVVEFSVERTEQLLTIRLAMLDLPVTSRRIVMETP